MLFPKPVGNTAIESFLSNTFCIISFCSDLSCRWNCLSCRIRLIISSSMWFVCCLHSTVDSRYLEFDGTVEKIRVNCSSTQEELWKYRKCSLFNDERETTQAKFWRAKTSIACLDSRNDLKLIRCFCCCFFSVKFFESCGMTDNC